MRSAEYFQNSAPPRTTSAKKSFCSSGACRINSVRIRVENSSTASSSGPVEGSFNRSITMWPNSWKNTNIMAPRDQVSTVAITSGGRGGVPVGCAPRRAGTAASSAAARTRLMPSLPRMIAPNERPARSVQTDAPIVCSNAAAGSAHRFQIGWIRLSATCAGIKFASVRGPRPKQGHQAPHRCCDCRHPNVAAPGRSAGSGRLCRAAPRPRGEPRATPCAAGGRSQRPSRPPPWRRSRRFVEFQSPPFHVVDVIADDPCTVQSFE